MGDKNKKATVTVQRDPTDGTLRITIEYEDGQKVRISTDSVFSPVVRAYFGCDLDDRDSLNGGPGEHIEGVSAHGGAAVDGQRPGNADGDLALKDGLVEPQD